jgi:hypothetical protein
MQTHFETGWRDKIQHTQHHVHLITPLLLNQVFLLLPFLLNSECTAILAIAVTQMKTCHYLQVLTGQVATQTEKLGHFIIQEIIKILLLIKFCNHLHSRSKSYMSLLIKWINIKKELGKISEKKSEKGQNTYQYKNPKT